MFLVSHLTSQHSLTLGVTAVMPQKTGFIIQTQYLFLLTDTLISDLLVSPLSSDTHEQYTGKKNGKPEIQRVRLMYSLEQLHKEEVILRASIIFHLH